MPRVEVTTVGPGELFSRIDEAVGRLIREQGESDDLITISMMVSALRLVYGVPREVQKGGE